VSLHLPENELIAGDKIENVHLYYDLAKVTIMGNAHCIKLIIHMPLKTANRQFTLYKIFALPTRISEDKFVKYFFEFTYN
jgi:hypothetical protein